MSITFKNSLIESEGQESELIINLDNIVGIQKSDRHAQDCYFIVFIPLMGDHLSWGYNSIAERDLIYNEIKKSVIFYRLKNELPKDVRESK